MNSGLFNSKLSKPAQDLYDGGVDDDNGTVSVGNVSLVQWWGLFHLLGLQSIVHPGVQHILSSFTD